MTRESDNLVPSDWLIKKVWGLSKNNWGSNLGAPKKTPKNLGG